MRDVDELEEIFLSLPRNIQMIALQWGGDDTVFGDEAYVFLKAKMEVA